MGAEARRNATNRALAHEAQIRAQQSQGPTVWSEVVIRFRPAEPGEPCVVEVYRQAIYALHAGVPDAPVTIQETTGNRESHVFHWGDVDRVKLVPSVIEKVVTN